MKQQKTEKKPKSFLHKLFKAVSLAISFLMFFLIAIIIYFFANKNEIAEKVLLSLNEKSSGEVIFQDISLHLFKQFPSISLALENIEFYENPESIRDSIEKPIGRFKTVYVALNIIDLISKEISVSRFILENGEINIIKYPNKSFNFLNALQVKKKKVVKKKPLTEKSNDKKPIEKKKVAPKKKPLISKKLKLSLDKIAFVNIKINFDNRQKKKEYAIHVPKLDASFSIMPDSIQVALNTDIEIKQLELSKKLNFSDQNLGVETNISIDRNDSIIKFKPSKLLIGKAEFKLDGIIDIKGDGIIDFTIDGSDKDVSFFSLVLTESGLKNIKKGDFYFNSTIKGNLKEELPLIECDFGLRDFNMTIPNTSESIKKLNIHGFFKSGNKLNLSEASLKIDTLTAQLPGGNIVGLVKINNFVKPYINYDLNMKLAIDGFENILKLGILDSLKGTISITDKFEGHLVPDSGWTVKKKDDLFLNFDSLSFYIPNASFGAMINGSLNNEKDSLHFNNLKVNSENTDLLINGSIFNLSNSIFDQGKEIIADLKIKSEILDLAQLLNYYPEIGENFPYQISSIDLDVQLATKASNFKKFKRTPKIKFNINHLDATINNLLSPLTINSGVFVLTELKNILFLDFKDLDINLAGSNLYGNFKYYSLIKKADSLRTQVKVKNLNLGKVFNTNPDDSIPLVLNAILNGYFDLKLLMQKKANERFNKIEFNTRNISYISIKDTIEIDSLQFSASNINYNLKKNTNPLVTLSGKMDFFADEIRTSNLKVQDVFYKTKAKNGTYTIIPENDKLFGVPVQGKFVISPFANPPNYHLQYSVKQFHISKLLTNFLEDTLLTGLMDFSFELISNGDNMDTIIKNLNGKIHMSANDLVLYGLNIDEFIKKYERSQNFNLLDIGAVVFAGPIGLAATKGTDFARIVITDYGESTNITSMVSEWDVVNGELLIDDLAFSTNKNRLAMKGWYNINTDSLDLQIAVLNTKGCSILSQSLSGSINKPKLGRIKVIKSLIAPVTNLLDKTLSNKCNPFYEGRVLHPEKEENP